jgi:hypothetical protein
MVGGLVFNDSMKIIFKNPRGMRIPLGWGAPTPESGMGEPSMDSWYNRGHVKAPIDQAVIQRHVAQEAKKQAKQYQGKQKQ